jgi:hypothetical protein
MRFWLRCVAFTCAFTRAFTRAFTSVRRASDQPVLALSHYSSSSNPTSHHHQHGYGRRRTSQPGRSNYVPRSRVSKIQLYSMFVTNSRQASMCVTVLWLSRLVLTASLTTFTKACSQTRARTSIVLLKANGGRRKRVLRCWKMSTASPVRVEVRPITVRGLTLNS